MDADHQYPNPDAAEHAVPPRSEPPSTADLQAQYELVSKSLDYLGLTIAALLLNYYTVDVQKHQIGAALAGAEIPFADLDLFPLQLSAGMMILSASTFFYDVSENAACTGSPDPVISESLAINSAVNAGLVLAASARIYNLFLVRFCAQPAGTAGAEVELGEDIVLEDSLLG